LTNLRQLLLVDIRLDPHLIEIRDREQCVARVHILSLRHLAIDNRSRGVGINRDVRNAILLRRIRLLAADSPKLQLVLARLYQRVGLRMRKRIVRLFQLIAILLCQVILLDCGGNFRAVNVGYRLSAAHALAGVLHIEFVHAATDARAHGGKLRLRLLNAAKRGNVRLQRGRAHLGNLHARRGDLGWSQLDHRAGLSALLRAWPLSEGGSGGACGIRCR
jgi:hypothetical protein